MCKHGTTTIIDKGLLQQDKLSKYANPKWIDNFGGIPVDSCIVEEIKYLIKKGVITVCCCCSHSAGIPDCLIDPESVELAKKFGYDPKLYTHTNSGYYEMRLKGDIK